MGIWCSIICTVNVMHSPIVELDEIVTCVSLKQNYKSNSLYLQDLHKMECYLPSNRAVNETLGLSLNP